MTRTEVKRKIKKDLNLTYYDLGRLWGVTSSMVSNFLNGKTKSARLERELAKTLGIDLDDLPGKRKAA